MAHKTIVVGAGLAGLSAAYELQQAGYDVQVFEAQQRVGGRVYTAPLSNGQYGELGAEFVDDNHTVLMNYAAAFNLKLDPACKFPDDLYWFIDGKLNNRKSLTTEQSAELDKLYAELKTLLEQKADPPQTLDQWLDEHQMPLFARRIARIQSRSLFAANPDSIGVGFFAHLNNISGGNWRIRGGSSRLVTALAEYLGERVHTGTPVRRIQQTDDTVTVSVETTNGLVEIVGDSAIAAIPWSVLRHIPLIAPLNDTQREAIFSLPYGGAIKTLLQYPKRFWSQPNFGIELLEGEYQAIWEPTFAQTGTNKILSCFSGGTPSRLLTQQTRKLAEQAVCTLYPHAPEAIACLSYDWSADEWSKGAYCYFKPKDLKRFNRYLMLSALRVFFAGEHTASIEYSGYMEGALRSGQRAAQQIFTL